MASELDETLVVEDDVDVSKDQIEWEALLAEMKARCATAGLGFSRKSIEFFDRQMREYAYVEIPNGKQKRTILLGSDDKVRDFLRISFEDLVYLGDLDAFVNYKSGVIEATIGSHDQIPASTLFRRLAKHFDHSLSSSRELDADVQLSVNEREDGGGVRVTIGRGSDTSKNLREGFGRSFLTIRLEGCNVKTHDVALKLLRKIADALFFQIDLNTGIALRLVKSRRSYLQSRLRSRFRGQRLTED